MLLHHHICYSKFTKLRFIRPHDRKSKQYATAINFNATPLATAINSIVTPLVTAINSTVTPLATAINSTVTPLFPGVSYDLKKRLTSGQMN
jgi:hypothetical protein